MHRKTAIACYVEMSLVSVLGHALRNPYLYPEETYSFRQGTVHNLLNPDNQKQVAKSTLTGKAKPL